MRAVRWRACRPHRNLKVQGRITSTGLTAPGHWTEYTSVQPWSRPRRMPQPLSQLRSRPTTATTTTSHFGSRPITAPNPQGSTDSLELRGVRPTREQGSDVPWWERSDGALGTPRDSDAEVTPPTCPLPRPKSIPRRLDQQLELPAATILPPLNIDKLIRSAFKSGVGGNPVHAAGSAQQSAANISAEAEDPFAIQTIIAAVGRVARRRVH